LLGFFFFDGIDARVLSVGQRAVSGEVSCSAASKTSSILAEAFSFSISELPNGI
jgi:hypothetical protein